MNTPGDLELPAGTRLVHIGPPKTGTTAVQRALHIARDQLRERGIYYPGDEARPRAAGWAVVGAGVPRGREQPTMADWDELVREVEAAGDQRVIVSNESFAVGYYKAVRKIVKGLGGDRIHVVYVVRRLDKLLNSHWQQRVQAGLTLPYHDWLEVVLGDEDPDNTHWRGFWRHHSLRDVMKRWKPAAGAERISLVIADENDRELLPRLFERFMGLPSDFLQLEHDRSNRSFTRNEIEMLRQLHLLGAEREWPDHVIRYLVQFGVVNNLSRLPRHPDDQSIALPRWAAERAAELNDERFDLVNSLGVRVIGDPEPLRTKPSGTDDEPADVRVAAQTAAQAIAAAIDAGESRRVEAATDAEQRISAAYRTFAAEQAPEGTEQRRVDEVSSRELLQIVRSRVGRRLSARR